MPSSSSSRGRHCGRTEEKSPAMGLFALAKPFAVEANGVARHRAGCALPAAIHCGEKGDGVVIGCLRPFFPLRSKNLETVEKDRVGDDEVREHEIVERRRA